MNVRLIRRTVIIIGSIVIIIMAAPSVIGYLIQGPAPRQGETDLRFDEITTDFVHRTDFDRALPFMALAAIDVDGDGTDEVFVGGGVGQEDALLSFTGSSRLDTRANRFGKDSLDPTYGAASIDANGDGRTDLFVARQSGVYLYENRTTGFVGQPVEFPLEEHSMPLSIALGDINRDGAIDLYVSNYIRPEYVEGETIFNRDYGGVSSLLLNRGDNSFEDITRSAGVYEKHNTFTAMFIDLDNDGFVDLVVAQDTGVVRLFRNNHDLTFTRVDLPQDYSYPMGIAASDYNNDGRIDLYFSNVGNTLPDFLLRGDLTDDQRLNKDYILLENKGDFRFEDVARQHHAARYGFGWGVVSFDFNNDTLADYLITQNYVRFPIVNYLDLYPGNLLQQNDDGNFYPVELIAGIANRKFGVTAVVSDFNHDGWLDAVIGNLDGPLRAFINSGGDRHWLVVRLRDVPESIGARLELRTSDGAVFYNQYYTSEGLGSDQTADVLFGLGPLTGLEALTVTFESGDVITVSDPEIDSIVDLSYRTH